MSAPWKWWTAIAGTLLVVGGIAWILALFTDAAAYTTFRLGFYSLLVGSTGLGARLTANFRETSVRGIVAVGSMAVFFLSFNLFSALLDEASGIFISAVVWLTIGLALLFGSVLEVVPNRLRASLIANRSRSLLVGGALVLIPVGLFVYHNSRVADEVICREDRVLNTGAATPVCVPPLLGEDAAVCELPPDVPIPENNVLYTGEVMYETCRSLIFENLGDQQERIYRSDSLDDGSEVGGQDILSNG